MCGAIFIDLLPTGRTRLATKDGVVEVAGSQVADATAVGIENQLNAFAQEVAVQGSTDVVGGDASARATQIGHAVNLAALTAERVEI